MNNTKNCPSQFHPASQSANGVPVSAAAGDDVRDGSRSRTDDADPRVRLYNASGIAALDGGGYPAVQARASLSVSGSGSYQHGNLVKEFACRWSKGAERFDAYHPKSRSVFNQCVFELLPGLGGGSNGSGFVGRHL